MQLRRIEFSRFHMLRFRFGRKVTTFFSNMQRKSEKNADSLTFMCYPVTFVTFTMQKEARAHHSGLFRYGNRRKNFVLGTACWGELRCYRPEARVQHRGRKRMRPPTSFSLIEATRADRSPKKSLVAKAVPVVFSGPTTPDP